MDLNTDTLMGEPGDLTESSQLDQARNLATTITRHAGWDQLSDAPGDTVESTSDQAQRISARMNDLSLAIHNLAVGTFNSLYACNQVQEIQNQLRGWETNPANMEHPQTVISHLNKFLVWNTGTPFESEVPITAVRNQVDSFTLAFQRLETGELDAW